MPVISPSMMAGRLTFGQMNSGHGIEISSGFLSIVKFGPNVNVTIRPKRKVNNFSIVPTASRLRARRICRHQCRPGDHSGGPLRAIVRFSKRKLVSGYFPHCARHFRIRVQGNQMIFAPITGETFTVTSQFEGADPFHTFITLANKMSVRIVRSLN